MSEVISIINKPANQQTDDFYLLFHSQWAVVELMIVRTPNPQEGLRYADLLMVKQVLIITSQA
jgi:hypothetical protein